jgi:predicted permease
VLFLLAASPTATISFVMVQAMKGNGELAANIVAQTTLWSLITVTLGLWILQILQFV